MMFPLGDRRGDSTARNRRSNYSAARSRHLVSFEQPLSVSTHHITGVQFLQDQRPFRDVLNEAEICSNIV